MKILFLYQVYYLNKINYLFLARLTLKVKFKLPSRKNLLFFSIKLNFSETNLILSKDRFKSLIIIFSLIILNLN